MSGRQVWRRDLRADGPACRLPGREGRVRSRRVGAPPTPCSAGGAGCESAQTRCDSSPGFPLAQSSVHDLRVDTRPGQRGPRGAEVVTGFTTPLAAPPCRSSGDWKRR